MIGGDAQVVEALRPAGKRWAKRSFTRAGPCWATHQDGQSDAHRHEHDRRVRSPPVRISRRSEPGDRHAIGRAGCCRKLVSLEPRAADHRQQLRPGLLRRAFHQGYGHRPGRVEADESVHAGVGPGAQLYVVLAAQDIRATARTPWNWRWPRCRASTGRNARADGVTIVKFGLYAASSCLFRGHFSCRLTSPAAT